MAVNLTLESKIQVEEELATNVPAAQAASRKVTHSLFNESATLTSATTPPVTQCAFFEQALTAGAATIDLTALPGTNGAVVNGNGLRVRAAKFKNKTSNANPITIKFGASNPYNLLGASWQVILSPGQSVLVYADDDAPAIAAGAKNIDLSGTAAQVLEVALVIG